MQFKDDDPTASARKQDHIALAFRSQTEAGSLDKRFDYEAVLGAHPTEAALPEITFLGKKFAAPVWISSMTGGTLKARTINRNLARLCGEFGFGMGLGSCRSLLSDSAFFTDFDVRELMGPDRALFANLGIAQIEQCLSGQSLGAIEDLVGRLDADGLIVHVNPMQEWLQPEGDRFGRPAIETIAELCEKTNIKLIVKEVGQGMGPESLRQLLFLPLEAVDFAAGGGTNFALLELLRSEPDRAAAYDCFARIGHSAEEMNGFVRAIVRENPDKIRCKSLIISGGIRDFLDGYYLTETAALPAVYGQASAFLRHAEGDYEALRKFAALQIEGLKTARKFLRPRLPH